MLMLNCLQIGEIARRSEGRRAGMKKTLVVAILMLVAGAGTFGQLDPFQGLNGPVAKVDEWSYKTEDKFGNTVEVWDGHSVTMYDVNQNDIDSIHYTKIGSIDKRYVRTFDSSGQLIQVEEYDWLGYLESKTLYQYEGNVEINRSYDANGDLESASDIEFDADGNPVRMTLYDVDTGDVSSVTENTYTTDGEPLSTRMYNDDGEVFMTLDNRYGVDGMDYISTSVIYLLGSVFMKTESGTRIIETDKHGNWTEKRRYEYKERFGKTEWILANIYRREITYR